MEALDAAKATESLASGGPVWVLVGVLVVSLAWVVRFLLQRADRKTPTDETLKFVLERLETAIRENTHAIKNQQIALVEILNALGVDDPRHDSGDPKKRAF